MRFLLRRVLCSGRAAGHQLPFFLAQDLLSACVCIRRRLLRGSLAGAERTASSGKTWRRETRRGGHCGVWRQRSTQQFAEPVGPYFCAEPGALTLAMAPGGWWWPGRSRRRLASPRCPGRWSIDRRHPTPSFFLGTLLQWLEIALYRATGVQLLPVGGFGWDRHLVLPVLVLAARPVAQVTRLAYAQFSTVFAADYVRTANAKGLRALTVWLRHITPNGATTVLTAMGTSLRFALSSLPVVEYMFGWPGAGRALLEALNTSQMGAATVLLLTLGALSLITAASTSPTVRSIRVWPA